MLKILLLAAKDGSLGRGRFKNNFWPKLQWIFCYWTWQCNVLLKKYLLNHYGFFLDGNILNSQIYLWVGQFSLLTVYIGGVINIHILMCGINQLLPKVRCQKWSIKDWCLIHWMIDQLTRDTLPFLQKYLKIDFFPWFLNFFFLNLCGPEKFQWSQKFFISHIGYNLGRPDIWNSFLSYKCRNFANHKSIFKKRGRKFLITMNISLDGLFFFFARLQDLYKSILLTDLESALDKKVEQDL